jgi:hypothetical protein
VLAAIGARLVGGAGRTALTIRRHFMIMQVRGLADGSGRLGRWPDAGVAIVTSAAVSRVPAAAGTVR